MVALSIPYVIGVVVGAVRAFVQSPLGRKFLVGLALGATRTAVKRTIRDHQGRTNQVELTAVGADIYIAEPPGGGSPHYYLAINNENYRIVSDTYMERVLSMVPYAKKHLDVTVLTDGSQIYIEQA